MSPPRPPPPPSPRDGTSQDAGFAPSSSVAGDGGGKGGSPPGQGGSPREGPRSPLATATSHPSSRGFSSLPPSGCGCGGDTRIPPPPTAPPPPRSPHRSRLHPPTPGQDPPSRLSDLRSFFYRDVSSRRAPCARERPPPRAGLPSPPAHTPPGVPWPPPPSPPHRPPPHGAGAVVVGNKSSLSVVPWGCGRRLVLRVGGPAGCGGGGGCHPLGSLSLYAPSLLSLCPRRILLAGAEPAPTRCLANERLITGAKSSKLHGN